MTSRTLDKLMNCTLEKAQEQIIQNIVKTIAKMRIQVRIPLKIVTMTQEFQTHLQSPVYPISAFVPL